MPESDAPLGVPARPPAPAERRSLLAIVQQLRSDPRAGAVVLALVLIAAVVVWLHASSANSVPAPATGLPPTAQAPNAAAGAPARSTTTSLAGVLVHVVGAVRASGVVELTPGARVRDAVAAAGGAADDADLERINLAAPVTDGQRVVVPRIGQPDPVPVGGGAATPDAAPPSPSGPLNLNTATAEELDALPGIGPTLADAIVRERQKLGGFRSVDDLKQVRGIGEGRFADIRDLVTV
jgi:competence protein ComEA